MIKNFEEIQRDLKNKEFAPVYFLYGEEPYYIDAISDYIQDFVLSESERAFNQTVIYGKESSTGNILEHAMRFPMMAQYNVIILKEAQEIKNLDEFTSYFKQPNPSTIVVFCCKRTKLDKRTVIYKTLKDSEYCLVMESPKVQDYKITGWIESIVKSKDFKITNKASALLSEYLGNDLSKITNEIEKLFKIKHESKTIDLDDIEKHIGISKEYNIFELQNALGAKNSAKTAMICKYIEANPKSNPFVLISSSIFNFFSRLYILESTSKSLIETGSKLGMQEWQLKSYYPALKNYKGKIENVLELIQEYDLKSKGINDSGTNVGTLTKELIFRILMI
ncbi:DNA polymerase III subunit delta [Bacteroidota bacterium]